MEMKMNRNTANNNPFETLFQTALPEQGNKLWDEGDRLTRAAMDAEYAKLSEDKLKAFVQSAFAIQDAYHLVNPLPGEKLPGDALVGIVYQRTYAVIAVAVYLKNKIGNEATQWMDCSLRPMMDSAFAGGIAGHGFDAGDNMRRVLYMLGKAGAEKFLAANPNYSRVFTACLRKLICEIEQHVNADKLDFAQSNLNCPALGRCPTLGEILAAWYAKTRPVFVYGTLKTGERAATLLSGAVFAGRAVMQDCQLYDLGNYPGLKVNTGSVAPGELYYADDVCVARLDRYEGEGTLYTRRRMPVTTEGKTLDAEVYVYNGAVSEKQAVEEWTTDEDAPVWYACYGSSLDSQRFGCYITGGTCAQNGKTYSGCRNTGYWSDSRIITHKGRMYFANSSASWSGKGVAFYSPDGEDKVIMRMYKITRGQLADIQKQEGCSDNWYGNRLFLGVADNGVPIFTLTSKTVRPQNEPGEAYLNLLKKALREECRMRKNEVEKYIAQCLKAL